MTQPISADRATAAETRPARPARQARSHLGAGRFLGVVGAVFAAAFAATLALPHDPYIRYQAFQGTIYDRLAWVYERLAFDPTPIDVLFVGSSRTARGANAALIQDALDGRGRPGIHVANISEPAAGLDIRLTKLREAFRHHPEIRLVVFGITEALPRDGHQAFGDLATPGEVLAAPWLINRTLPANLAALPYRQMELALATALPEAFGYRAGFDPGAYLGPAPDHRVFNDPDAGPPPVAERPPLAHALALAEESALRRTEIRPPVLPESLAWLEFGVSRSYLDRIVRLVRAEGAEIVFLFLPFYDGYAEPLDRAWLETIAPVWTPGFLRDDPALYYDAAHASEAGIDRLSVWLADRIDTYLETHP